MNKKRTLAMLLAGAMLLPANAFAASPEDFTDFPTDWSAAGLRSAVQNGLLNGSNGQINSSGLLIRAQMAAIINRAFAARKTADLSVYSDANTSAWYYNDLELAVAMRTFQGANGKLNPEAPITREEAFVVLARAFALESGDTSVLNNYTDGASVSAWAQSSVAALIENGYVNGANGKLNPKTSITRAEFAKVISEMASTYADADDSLSATVDGSVIVRENSVSLSGKTINGDLIIADGVSRIDLTGVTVTGRIVLRGGESGVTFKDTKAGKGIIANTDIAVSGSVDNITVAQGSAITVNSGASVGSINVNAEGAKITGAGKVGTVKANANNVTVTTTGTKVTAADSISGVKAGDKAVSAGKTETVGSTASGGGSSSGGSSSGGSSSGSNTTVKAEIADAQVVTTDAGAYLALSFRTGFTKENTVITVDGADVTKYATPVTDDGSVIKLPLVAQPGSVTLTSGNKTQTTDLGTKVDGAVYTGDHYLPDYFVKHGPLAIWDYYLTNYDVKGNIRTEAEKTTFGTKAVPNPHPSYSVATELGQDVVIMFNYTLDADKQWFDHITPYSADNQKGSVQLVSYDQYKGTWNYNLEFTKGKTNHAGNTVATLTIKANQDNFRSNGRYFVRVTSTDAAGVTSSTLVPIHVVNAETPTFEVEEKPESGKNLHFAVSNLVYGITNPIEKVTLTDPSGAKHELTNINDYYLFSQDLFVLYNDESAENGTNHLKYKGQYTLTIEANGFKTATTKFTVQEGKTAPTQTALTLDAVSRATGSISGGSSSDGSSSGYAISTDFLFKGDLIANACVLNKLNKDTTESTAVLEYWNYSTSTLDSTFNKGNTMYYSGTDYMSYIYGSKADSSKLWKPFAEYTASAAASVNPPHQTKEVMEDGLLGDVLDSSVSGKLNYVAPDKGTYAEGDDVVLKFTADSSNDYLSKITGLYLNGDWRYLGENYYTINTENNTITIKKDLLHIGENAIKIVSGGYKEQNVTFNYAKVTEGVTGLTVSADQEGKPVTITVNGSDGDFLKNLSLVTLKQGDDVDNVYWYGYEGSDAVYYVKSDDNKTLTLYNVKPGTYTVTLSAQYYDDLSTDFTMAGTVVKNPVPDMDIQQSVEDGVYTVKFYGVKIPNSTDYTDSQIGTWKLAINKISVNGTNYTEYSSFSGDPANDSTEYKWGYGQGSEKVLILGGSAFKTGENKVVISAKGYKDLTVTINKSAETVTEKDTPSLSVAENGVIKDGNSYKITLTGTDLADWWKNVKKVQVDEGTAADISKVIGETAFTLSGLESNHEYTLTFTADGYKNATVKVKTPEKKSDNTDTEVKLPTTAPTVKSTSTYSSKYILDFSNNKAWVQKITSIKLGGSACKPVTSADDVSSDKYYLDTENGYIYMYLSMYAEKKLVIAADGCDKLVLTAVPGSGWSAPTITYVGTVSAEPSAAPTIAKIEKVPASFITASFYRVSFSSDEIEDYLNNVKKVTLDNNVELKSGGIYNDSTKTFKIGTESSSGAKSYLDFSKDCFTKGNTTVTIKANDYKDLTFTVTVDADGNLSIK